MQAVHRSRELIIQDRTALSNNIHVMSLEAHGTDALDQHVGYGEYRFRPFRVHVIARYS